jgi:hypothetical protein
MTTPRNIITRPIPGRPTMSPSMMANFRATQSGRSPSLAAIKCFGMTPRKVNCFIGRRRRIPKRVGLNRSWLCSGCKTRQIASHARQNILFIRTQILTVGGFSRHGYRACYARRSANSASSSLPAPAARSIRRVPRASNTVLPGAVGPDSEIALNQQSI